MASESKDNFSFDILNIHDFLQNRDPRRDITFDDEQILKSYIINNDPRALELAMSLFNVDRMGEMSKDPQKQIIMGCIASITLNTRSFVRAGIPWSIAYAISDMYLQQLDFNFTKEQATEWYYQSFSTFSSMRNVGPTDLMGKTGTSQFSKLVTSAINYIYKNLYSNITLKDVATSLYVTPDYLSHLFRTETGVTFSRFVRKQKIEMAKIMLMNSASSLAEISNSLSFCSQSYFTKVFHEETGYTPNEYIELSRNG